MLKLIDIDNVGVVGARLLYSNTNKIQHCGVTFSNRHGLPYHFRAGEISNEQDMLNREFQAVTGAVWMTKTKYFENICKNSDGSRGLDQKYRWGFEDIAASLSIKYEMNKKIVFCGQTDIYHDESHSLNKNPQHKLFLQNNSQHLLQTWRSRYILDDHLYINNPKYNIIK
jgi:exonuclease III